MKKTFTLLIMICGMFAGVNAQTALNPELTVNEQITAAGVYTVEAGKFYAFDGRIDLTFEVSIIGPDQGWVMEATDLPVLVNTPAADGAARQFFEIKEGGALTLKNVMFSGSNNNDEVGSTFIANTGGSKLILDNCVITDWQDFALRNQFKGDSLSVTNSVFINGLRIRYSQWGGFPMRMDVACDNVIWENNTVVNSGRLLANSGPFENAKVHQIHNTYLNQSVAGEEQRANEFLIANNLFYNYHFLGRTTENHSSPDNTYGSYFTTWNYFADSKDNLDSISLYLGQNLFFRPQELLNFFETSGGDSIAPSLLWEHADVDSFILIDDNYTIGTNYFQIDPEFTMHPGNTEVVASNVSGQRLNPTGEWVDWRITSPVSFDATTGAPALNWPPAFDLSYANEYLQTAGTDGLPIGDLNWFPTKKAEYLANKGAILESLRDSTVNAVAVYDPETMDATPMITPSDLPSSVNELVDPTQLNSSGNFPNPFTAITTIEFGIKQQSDVTLSVFDLLGQRVFQSTQSGLAPGSYVFNFDGSNHSAGTYFYKINAIGANGQNYVTSKKMILSK